MVVPNVNLLKYLNDNFFSSKLSHSIKSGSDTKQHGNNRLKDKQNGPIINNILTVGFYSKFLD